MEHRTALDTPPVSSVLARLFAEADRADAGLRERFGALPTAERSRLHEDYRELYGVHAREAFLPVSRATGRLLYLLTRAARPSTVVEFGTSFGISTLFLAAALRDAGGGRVIGTELEPTKAARARTNLSDAGLGVLVEIREGDALESLSRDLPAGIGLVLLDGAKVLYPRILALLEPRLAKGALVLADNADMSAEYRARVRDGGRYLAAPVSEEVELAMWLG